MINGASPLLRFILTALIGVVGATAMFFYMYQAVRENQQYDSQLLNTINQLRAQAK